MVWLVAYRRHRSGAQHDFFPYAKNLDERDELLPTADDYERLIADRGARFAYAIRIEAPLILAQARKEGREQRVMLGGRYGACIALEVADELEMTTIAFKTDTAVFDHVPIILAAFHADQDGWDQAQKMPSRPLGDDEIAFAYAAERTSPI